MRQFNKFKGTKGFISMYPGHCLAFDTIEKQRNDNRMYILVALDLYSRVGFALGTKSHGSQIMAHFHTYPRTSKMNANCERLNRTLQEEFIDYNINLLFDDITNFNKKFSDYLLFYNEKRVHHAFKNKCSPLQAMLQSKHYKINLPSDCKNGWTYTYPLQEAYLMLSSFRTSGWSRS